MPVYKFSKWQPSHVRLGCMKTLERGAAQTDQSLGLSPDAARWTDNIIRSWHYPKHTIKGESQTNMVGED